MEILNNLKSELAKRFTLNIKDTVRLLYDTFLLNFGFIIEDPNDLAKGICKMIFFGLHEDPLPATETKSTEKDEVAANDNKPEDKKG